jgi:hypothetical protein
MSALRGRDKRTQRLDVVAAKHAALEPSDEVWESAPEWWRDFCAHSEMTDDQAWRDALADANGRSNEINGSRG